MIIRKSLWICLTLLIALPAFASIDAYQFDTEDQEKRFFSLTHELRCPKCQNQSIADSDAPIANDLRREVHRMLLAGKDDQGIVDFMLARYGDFVLYRPQLESKTALLWIGPPLLLVIGLFVLFMVVRRHRSLAVSGVDKQGCHSDRSSEEGV